METCKIIVPHRNIGGLTMAAPLLEHTHLLSMTRLPAVDPDIPSKDGARTTSVRAQTSALARLDRWTARATIAGI